MQTRADACEAGMVGHPARLHPVRQPDQALQMPVIQAGGRAQTQADAVQADRIGRAAGIQHGQRGAAIGEEVFGMNLDEVEVGTLIEQRLVMRLAPADAHRGAGWRGRRGRSRQGLLLDLGLGLVGGHAAGALAAALGDVLPFVDAVVDLAQARAGMAAAQVGAVVLAGLGNAEAFLLGLVLGLRLGHHAQGQGSGEGRGHEGLGLHGRVLQIALRGQRC
mmetsp:Transcript_53146/g.124440  ORF Transcript_53146/g.124440 Transcript_53146/m.124440 type:complete len:220 (-) Transcript_53146:1046-1705(-)